MITCKKTQVFRAKESDDQNSKVNDFFDSLMSLDLSRALSLPQCPSAPSSLLARAPLHK